MNVEVEKLEREKRGTYLKYWSEKRSMERQKERHMVAKTAATRLTDLSDQIEDGLVRREGKGREVLSRWLFGWKGSSSYSSPYAFSTFCFTCSQCNAPNYVDSLLSTAVTWRSVL